MEYRSLSFKYWVEFDEDGEIKSLHKSKYVCASPCEEYVVKLIPIQRDVTKEVEKALKKTVKTIETSTKKLDTEFKKVLKDVKGVLK